MCVGMGIGLIVCGLFGDRMGVNDWFLVWGILIIWIGIVWGMISEIRKLDGK